MLPSGSKEADPSKLKGLYKAHGSSMVVSGPAMATGETFGVLSVSAVSVCTDPLACLTSSFLQEAKSKKPRTPHGKIFFSMFMAVLTGVYKIGNLDFRIFKLFPYAS